MHFFQIADLHSQIFLRRFQRGVSQEALASQLGKGQPYVSKVEQGIRRISVLDAFEWAAALGVTFQELEKGLEEIYKQVASKSLWEG